WRLVSFLNRFEDAVTIVGLEQGRAGSKIPGAGFCRGMQRRHERLVRDSMLRWQQHLGLGRQPNREDLQLPNAVFGAVSSARDGQDTKPPADPGQVAQQLVTNLNALAPIPLALSKAGHLRPGLLELLVGL